MARWASGTPSDSEDTMNFAQLSGVKALNEIFPVSKVRGQLTTRLHFAVPFEGEIKTTLPSLVFSYGLNILRMFKTLEHLQHESECPTDDPSQTCADGI